MKIINNSILSVKDIFLNQKHFQILCKLRAFICGIKIFLVIKKIISLIKQQTITHWTSVGLQNYVTFFTAHWLPILTVNHSAIYKLYNISRNISLLSSYLHFLVKKAQQELKAQLVLRHLEMALVMNSPV